MGNIQILFCFSSLVSSIGHFDASGMIIIPIEFFRWWIKINQETIHVLQVTEDEFTFIHVNKVVKNPWVPLNTDVDGQRMMDKQWIYRLINSDITMEHHHF